MLAGTEKLAKHVSASRDGASTVGVGSRVPMDANNATLSFVERNKALFEVRDVRASLRMARSEVDDLGMTHARFQQTTHGIPVSGAEMTAHYDPAGRITSLDSNVVAGVEDLDVQPTIDAPAGASLVVFAREGREPRLAWKSVIRSVPGAAPHVWVTTIDAKTGVVLERFDNLQHLQGSGVGVLGDTKKIEVTAQGNAFVMTDTSRGVTITTHTSAGREASVGAGATVISSNSATSWDTAGVGRGAAVDAHFYAGVVFDHYKKVHARNGLDGAGGPMLSSVHYGVAFANSFWDGTSMSYGDGADGSRAESAGLDVVGHEFTHGVTEATSNLEYLSQSGALNESISDIFAVFIEHGIKPDEVKNWVLFEDVGGGLRDMKDPKKYEQPSNMSEYVNTQQDNGGVHINSGIPNNAMALMTVGGTNPASKVEVKFGLGWEKSEKLWYRAATKYFQARTDFAQAGQGLMQAAKDIALTENEQNIVDCSLKAVGIVNGACATIVDPTAKVPVPADPSSTSPTDPKDGDVTGGGSTDDEGSEEVKTPKKPSRNGVSQQASSGCNVGTRGNTDLGVMLLGALGVLVYRRKRR